MQSLPSHCFLRAGSLLGAHRHAGIIPGDRDLDAVVLLPLNETLADFRNACVSRLQALGSPFDLQVIGTGPFSWLVFLPWRQSLDGGKPMVADLTIFPSSNFLRTDAHPSEASVGRVRDVFSSLCRCTFSRVEASCFSHAPAYLALTYGEFNLLSERHANQKQIFDSW